MAKKQTRKPAASGASDKRAQAIESAQRNAAAIQGAVFVPEYDLIVEADGTVKNFSAALPDKSNPAPVPSEAPDPDDEFDPDSLGLDDDDDRGEQGDDGLDDDPDPVQNPVETGDNPADIVSMVAEYKALGLSDADALTLAQKRLAETSPAAPAPEETPPALRQVERQAERDGPDPALVHAYKEKMKNYTPPVLEKTYTVVVPARFAIWIDQWAAWQAAQRRRPVSESDVIQMMIREHWKDKSQERALLQGTATGPASRFDPTTGNYS